jgi:predicted Zn-ribbon and HTH transcriptional regulator
MSKILRNAARCKKCGETIESFSVHDFKWCKCKSLAVDGGHEYLRRVGHTEDSVDLSEVEE